MLSNLDAFYFFWLLNLVLCCVLTVLCWIKLVKANILAFFLILEKELSVFHHWVWCALWIFMYGFYYVKVASLLLVCWVPSSWKAMAFFSRTFLYQLRWSCGVSFPLYCVNVVHYIDRFLYVKPSCLAGINFILPWCIIILICCWTNIFMDPPDRVMKIKTKINKSYIIKQKYL